MAVVKQCNKCGEIITDISIRFCRKCFNSLPVEEAPPIVEFQTKENDISADRVNDISADRVNDVSTDRVNDVSADRVNNVSADRVNDFLSNMENNVLTDRGNYNFLDKFVDTPVETPNKTHYQTPIGFNNRVVERSEEYHSEKENHVPSLVLSIIGLIFSLLIPFVALIILTIGLVMAVRRRGSHKTKAAIVMCIIGYIIAIMMFTLSFILLMNVTMMI